MCQWIKQSTAITVKIGPFLDNVDGFTAEGSLTLTQPDIRLSKNGGDFVQKNAAQTLTHDENGFYGLSLDATDTNTLGRLTVQVNETGALPVWHDFMVVSTNVWNTFFSSDTLDVTLANNINHGGTSAVITASRIIVASNTPTEPAVKLTGNTTGAGIECLGGASGDGIKADGGATTGDGIHASNSSGVDIRGDITGSVSSVGAAVTVGTINANAISNTAIADDAISAAKLATDSITADAVASEVDPVLVRGQHDGTASQTTVFSSALSAGNANAYKGCIIRFEDTAIAGECAIVTSFTPSTDSITIAPSVSQNIPLDCKFSILAYRFDQIESRIADAIWDEVTTDHVAERSFGARMAPLHQGKAEAGAASTITLDSTAPGYVTTTDYYRGNAILLTGGTGAGQCKIIESNTNAGVCTILGSWATNPDATTNYTIVPFGISTNTATGLVSVHCEAIGGSTDAANNLNSWSRNLQNIDTGTTQAGSTTSTIVLQSGAEGTNDGFYNGMLVQLQSGGAGRTGAVRMIIDYVASTRTATVFPNWDSAPLSSNDYTILPSVGNTMLKYGTIQTTITDAGQFHTDLTEASDYWNNAILYVLNGNAAYSARKITDYIVTSGEIFLDVDLPATPSNGDRFVILGYMA